ncbi:MAG: glycosyltransferase [Zoogloeaceae bacterium]|jgi:rhamnosyltransferase|nr:glycosyltransferase [Zoogloeaceae bacterium]
MMTEHDLVSVTVTYNPELLPLCAQLSALSASCTKLIVDNGSNALCIKHLAALPLKYPNLHLIFNSDNLGLATAINQGVRAAHEINPHASLLLLLDQDTEPQPGSIETLIHAFAQLKTEGQCVGAVGPLLRDVETGLTHGFHQCTHWRWRRVYPHPDAKKNPIPCANLNGSGTLMSIDIFLELGGLDESLFIDHVDTEWSFRLLSRQLGLWGIPHAVFLHRMGQRSTRFWFFGWRLWPTRSPQRHYFLFRNAVWLMRRNYVPTVWKCWAVLKLAVTCIMHTLFGPQRNAQLKCMLSGIREQPKIHAEKLSLHNNTSNNHETK